MFKQSHQTPADPAVDPMALISSTTSTVAPPVFGGHSVALSGYFTQPPSVVSSAFGQTSVLGYGTGSSSFGAQSPTTFNNPPSNSSTGGFFGNQTAAFSGPFAPGGGAAFGQHGFGVGTSTLVFTTTSSSMPPGFSSTASTSSSSTFVFKPPATSAGLNVLSELSSSSSNLRFRPVDSGIGMHAGSSTGNLFGSFKPVFGKYVPSANDGLLLGKPVTSKAGHTGMIASELTERSDSHRQPTAFGGEKSALFTECSTAGSSEHSGWPNACVFWRL